MKKKEKRKKRWLGGKKNGSPGSQGEKGGGSRRGGILVPTVAAPSTLNKNVTDKVSRGETIDTLKKGHKKSLRMSYRKEGRPENTCLTNGRGGGNDRASDLKWLT